MHFEVKKMPTRRSLLNFVLPCKCQGKLVGAFLCCLFIEAICGGREATRPLFEDNSQKILTRVSHAASVSILSSSSKTLRRAKWKANAKKNFRNRLQFDQAQKWMSNQSRTIWLTENYTILLYRQHNSMTHDVWIMYTARPMFAMLAFAWIREQRILLWPEQQSEF